jgi:hypothetical protein
MYNEARPQICTGDLIAFSHTKSGSFYDFQVHAVRVATESEFSHVSLAYVTNERIFILEAVSSGVRMFPLSRAGSFYWVKNPETLSEDALNQAFLDLGLPYENKFKMVLNMIFKMNLNKNRRLQCSEYVNEVLAVNKQILTIIDIPTSIVTSAMRYWGALTYVEN